MVSPYLPWKFHANRSSRFAWIQNVTDDRRQTDRRHAVPKARPIVRSAKNHIRYIPNFDPVLFRFKCHCSFSLNSVWLAVWVNMFFHLILFCLTLSSLCFLSVFYSPYGSGEGTVFQQGDQHQNSVFLLTKTTVKIVVDKENNYVNNSQNQNKENVRTFTVFTVYCKNCNYDARSTHRLASKATKLALRAFHSTMPSLKL